jgi:hypothetical protein
MATITFDTLQYVEKLKTGGFSDEQAKVMVKATSEILDEVITKTVHEQVQNAENTLRGDLRVSDRKIESIEAKIDLLRAEMREQEQRQTASLYRALLLQTVAVIGVVFTMMRLFPATQ